MQKPDIYHRSLTSHTPEQIDALVKQLKPVLGSMHKQVRAQFTLHQRHCADYQQQASYTNATMNGPDYMLSKQASEAYNAWQAGVDGSLSNPEDEFCLQTTYMHFVRIFFVRACEDYGLISPHLIPGETFTTHAQFLSEFPSCINNTYSRFLKQTYQRAGSEQHNPLYYQELYDWFTADKQTTLALYTLLKHFNFQELNVDILGKVYNEGYIANEERSAKGQFYTPLQVVDYILDSLGIPTFVDIVLDYRKCLAFLDKTLGDLSCGSGSFLVAAAARKRHILQCLLIEQGVNPEYALQILTNTVLGFDLNPFACYLAEMNLLIQCLPFLVDEQDRLCRSIGCFHIYCADILEPAINEQTGIQLNGKHSSSPSSLAHRQALTDEERRVIEIKEAKGLPEHAVPLAAGKYGLDYLVGNPPYVSAGESPANLLYRNEVWNFGIYKLLHQRWDLFVPFFERNLQFLRPETGRLGLIVSNGIETEGYAERLRQALSSQYRLLQIDFFPGLRLFQDAAVESTIVYVEHRVPGEQHEVKRRKHLLIDCKHFETLPTVLQSPSNNGKIFRWRYDSSLDKSLAEGTIPLCAIAYTGTGIEAQSAEHCDPLVDGKRQKLFTLHDVFLQQSAGTERPAEYLDDGVLGEDIDSYYLHHRRYVAFEKYRLHMRGPRHPALFRIPEKLLLGETSGGYYDRDGLFANHSVQVVAPWKALAQAGAIEERGIRGVYRKSQQLSGITGDLASIAELFDLRYLLAIINSRFMRAYLTSNMHKGTRKGRIYPDVWKRLPIKIVSAERQQQIATLVDAVQARYRQNSANPNTLLSDIEASIEVIYRESVDTQVMEIING